MENGRQREVCSERCSVLPVVGSILSPWSRPNPETTAPGSCRSFGERRQALFGALPSASGLSAPRLRREVSLLVGGAYPRNSVRVPTIGQAREIVGSMLPTGIAIEIVCFEVC